MTIIKVEPLPEGTTDVDTMEAGWDYVDEGKIVVYGAIDPIPNILEKLDGLAKTIEQMPDTAFKSSMEVLAKKVEVVKKQVTNGAYSGALLTKDRFLVEPKVPEGDKIAFFP